MPATRRIHHRIAINIPIEYEEFERFHPDKLLNLSAGGAFILTPKPLSSRRHFCFKFTLPELPGRTIRACGSVVWSPTVGKAPKARHPMGMGVEFDFSDGDLIKFLDEYVTVSTALRSLDGRIGNELPDHVRAELPKPDGGGVDVNAVDLISPTELRI